MTKTYKINGRKIEVEEIYFGLNEFAFLELLKALSDKEEPKQEEWKPCTCPKGSTDCDKCDGVEWIKQSTSLKEDRNSLKYQVSYLLWNENNFTKEETDKYSDKILSLIQSHLVKEIEEQGKRVAPENYDIYQARQDIIKIINNI